jgi:hypothetical protein
VINNRDEIAFPVGLADATGKLAYGILFRGADGNIQPIALPGQDLLGLGVVINAVLPSINNAGRVAFLTQPTSDLTGPGLGNAAYLWDRGALTTLAAVGGGPVGGAQIAALTGVWVNDANSTILLLAHEIAASTGPRTFYRYADGKLTPILGSGKEMPGGGVLRDVPRFGEGVSWPNSVGQHAFIGNLADGANAVYLLDAAGTPSLVMKDGDMTTAGRVLRIAPGTPPLTGTTAGRSFGVGLNASGQVAVPVQLEGGVNAVLLVTPGSQGPL